MNISNNPTAIRIAFYIASLDHGGAERVTSILANKFAELDIEVTVFVMKPITAKSYTLAENVRVVNLAEDVVLNSVAASLVFNLKRIITLRRAVKQCAPQALYTMMTKANVIGSLALIGCKVPCIVSERNDPSQYPVGRLWDTLRKIAYRYSYSVVAQTARAKCWLEQNTRATRVEVIPNPIKIPMIDGQPHVEAPGRRGPMIMAVGRLCPQKQFNHLIEAFALLADEFPLWRVAILGEGEDFDSLNEMISAHGLKGKVELHGRVGNMGDWYKCASLFVMTSLYEGYPNALIEAMANGVPAVSYDCPSGPAEVIQHGVSGRLAEANNVHDLVANMRAIMSDESVARQISTEAKKIATLLDPDDIAIQWLSVAGLRSPVPVHE